MEVASKWYKIANAAIVWKIYYGLFCFLLIAVKRQTEDITALIIALKNALKKNPLENSPFPIAK